MADGVADIVGHIREPEGAEFILVGHHHRVCKNILSIQDELHVFDVTAYS